MAEDKEKSSTNASGGASSTTAAKSANVTAASGKNAAVYTDEQIKQMVDAQKANEERLSKAEAAGFDISDEELPENITPNVESAKLPEGVTAVVAMDPALFGIVQKTEGLDKSIPGGKYVVIRGNKAYYVNANGEDITEDGKLINPRTEVNVVNMVQPTSTSSMR